MLGVDPIRLPPKDAWTSLFKAQFSLPVPKRRGCFAIWLMDGRAIGFSSCDKIVFGEQANMHLHVTEPSLRQQGIGAQCVRESVDLYFRALEIKQLFCEPHAFNIGPNRTLQRAGFRYVKTYIDGAWSFELSSSRGSLAHRAPVETASLWERCRPV